MGIYIALFYTWWRHQMETFSTLLALCVEFTGHMWIPLTKTSDAELWYFLWSAPWRNDWVNNREAGDWRRHLAHYDVIVMTDVIMYPCPNSRTGELSPHHGCSLHCRGISRRDIDESLSCMSGKKWYRMRIQFRQNNFVHVCICMYECVHLFLSLQKKVLDLHAQVSSYR